ncbi:BHLH domain-containing protein [Mycena sanguinolenta]|uniref:BHLH domain-containing protein n=1 Tax=Mycena sanguinolenta TaxID=230812 RepID=A0A8H7DC01_9AGAR|nr:BHLH domain-containing protein [Mycena sanguinolenta]
MALTINPPSPASSFTSDASSNSTSTGPPQTPVLSDLPLVTPVPSSATKAVDSIANNAANAGGVKRTTKPSRRANTAERRATHNAVERQRRETLNGRFLDLAALLPNLSQIRRPSKSSIVNSSIAHINASRRHRVLASQQLRLLKSETDALRHEVNEWRMRAGVPAVEEPRRADGFAVVLSGELEFEAGDMMEGGEEGEDEEDFRAGSYGPYGTYDEPEEFIHLQQQQQRQPVELMAQPQFIAPEVAHHTQPMTIAIGPQPHSRQSHSPPHFASPPSTAAFENSMYDQHTRQLHHHQLMLQHHQQQQQQESKWAYQQQMRAQQVQMQGAW